MSFCLIGIKAGFKFVINYINLILSFQAFGVFGDTYNTRLQGKGSKICKHQDVMSLMSEN